MLTDTFILKCCFSPSWCWAQCVHRTDSCFSFSRYFWCSPCLMDRAWMTPPNISLLLHHRVCVCRKSCRHILICCRFLGSPGGSSCRMLQHMESWDWGWTSGGMTSMTFLTSLPLLLSSLSLGCFQGLSS